MPTAIDFINDGPEEAAKLRPVPRLLHMLAHHTLCPTFENYGNFVYNVEGRPGFVHVWGNFADYSFAFSITTDDAELIAQLTAAIRTNQATPAYAEAKAADYARHKFWRDREEERRQAMRNDARRRLRELAR